jgi:hypothetical protein
MTEACDRGAHSAAELAVEVHLNHPDMTVAFIEALVERFEVFRPSLIEHIRGNRGETIAHEFIVQVVYYAEALFRGIQAKDDACDVGLRQLLAFMEEWESTENDSVRAVIQQSFLETLPHEVLADVRFQEMLGPGLTGELRLLGY